VTARGTIAEIEGRSAAAKARAIAAAMRTTGVAIVRGPLDRPAYFAIASALGRIFHEASIYVDPTASYYVRSPGPVPFHTDHVRANVVSWLCEVPEAADNCYLDATRVFAELTAAQRTALQKVHAYCPYPRQSRLDPDRPVLTTPIVSAKPARFFWVPLARPADEIADLPTPCIHAPTTAGGRAAIAAFRARIEVPAEAADVRVRLAAGEAIFVDNNRFMHGRGALPPTSPRRLYRFWINTDGWASAERHHVREPALDARV
jgi:alpha-ketoglutarate-dependent taurine dioxygenase